MCGIVAVFGNVTVPIEKVFKDMLVFDTVRGHHSTGVCFVTKQSDEANVSKVVGVPQDLFDTTGFTKNMGKAHRLLLGHNRWATQGKVTKENAHPFTCGAITGVHNGSLRGYTKLEGYGEFDVDSHVLYNHISEHGLKDAVEKTDGAMALVWWDEETSALNIFRNDQRPLFLGMTADKQVGLIASESWMIEAACARQDVKLDRVVAVPVQRHLTMVLPVNTYAKQLNNFTFEDIPVKVEEPTYFGTMFRGNVVGAAANTTSTVTTPPATVSQQKPHLTVVPPANVIFTCCDFNRVVYGNVYYEFYEEVEDGRASRSFIIPAQRAKDLNIKLGDTFRGDSSGYMLDKTTNDTLWFIRAVNLEQLGKDFTYSLKTVVGEVIDADEVTEESTDSFPNPLGHQISREQWYKNYGCCSYCTGDIDHRDRWRFNSQGNIYCEECCDNPVVADCLPK